VTLFSLNDDATLEEPIPRTQRPLIIPAAFAGSTKMNAGLVSILFVSSYVCMQQSSSLRGLLPICMLRLCVLSGSSVKDEREGEK
jgi:hypothetical protein